LSTLAVPSAPHPPVAERLPAEHAAPASRAVDGRLILFAVVAISVAYVGATLWRGWVPYDDGALAQSAERLMQGELPHRDFDEIYTGGLAWLNAGAFRLFGMSLWSIRIALLAVFVAWVPAVYYIASRFVRPIAAGAITLLAVTWSLPNYTAAMPSWYNLFLATFGAAALMRHVEDGRRRWLVAAGIAGGLSFLAKLVGLFYVAGVLLFLVYRAHDRSRDVADRDASRGTAYAVFVSAALAVFVAALVVLVRHRLVAPELAQFVVPGAAIAVLLVRNEWSQPAGASRERFMSLGRLLVPFLIGVAVPIAIFLLPYIRSGSVGAFATGVFVLPMKRFGVAEWAVPPLTTMLASVPLVMLALLASTLRKRAAQWLGIVVALGLAVLFVMTGRSDPAYRAVWYSVRMLLPGLVVAGVLLCARKRSAVPDDRLLRDRTMVLLCVTALCMLVQFPYAVPIYFCYVAPLVALVALALCSHLRIHSIVVPSAVVLFLTAFAVVRVNDSTLYTMGVSYQPYGPTLPLALERGGLEVPAADAVVYRRVVALVRMHAKGGYLWASPDCPEVYFLTGLKNPTRTLFDFFDQPPGRTGRVLDALDQRGVSVIVLNARASFSPTLPDDLVAELEARYPFGTNVGQFQVRWQ
jgi:4-amino-4-deoxy-L-arabinose transferase-like glycosyltransferase